MPNNSNSKYEWVFGRYIHASLRYPRVKGYVKKKKRWMDGTVGGTMSLLIWISCVLCMVHCTVHGSRYGFRHGWLILRRRCVEKSSGEVCTHSVQCGWYVCLHNGRTGIYYGDPYCEHLLYCTVHPYYSICIRFKLRTLQWIALNGYLYEEDFWL